MSAYNLRYSGERVLLFALDSNLRVSSVKDAKGAPSNSFRRVNEKIATSLTVTIWRFS